MNRYHIKHGTGHSGLKYWFVFDTYTQHAYPFKDWLWAMHAVDLLIGGYLSVEQLTHIPATLDHPNWQARNHA